MDRRVGEVLHVLGRGLRRLAQDQLAVGAASGEVSTLDVHRRAGRDLGGERSAGPGEPAGQGRARGGAEVVRVGHVRVPEAGREQLVEDAGVEQRRIDVAMPRRAPLEVRVRRPLHRGEVVGAQLRLLRLHHVEREAVDGQVGVRGERRQAVVLGVERVEEQQRETYAVGGPGRQHLTGDQVEEAQPVAYRQQGLRLAQPHRRTQPSVEPDHHGLRERVHVLGGLRDAIEPCHVADGGDRRLGDHAGGAGDQLRVVVGEDRDRRVRDPGSAHLLGGQAESVGHGTTLVSPPPRDSPKAARDLPTAPRDLPSAPRDAEGLRPFRSLSGSLSESAGSLSESAGSLSEAAGSLSRTAQSLSRTWVGCPGA